MNDSSSRWIAAALGALVALGSATLGGAIGYRGALDSQERQAREARVADDREIRRETYLGYLEAADAFRHATNAVLITIKSHPEPGSPEVEKAFNDFMTARTSYQGMVNRLYVYGSDAAWRRHRPIAAALPYAVGYVNKDRLTADLVSFGQDQEGYTNAYNAFLELMCEELPARPRGSCGE